MRTRFVKQEVAMTLLSARQQALLQLARKFHLSEYRDAVGRCFAAALGLAQAAHEQGIAVHLVRWQVTDDRDFCDHWVVACGDGMVIDLTRVQVDGKTGLLHPISSYPENYCDMRRYCASLLLPLFEQLRVGDQDRMPFAFMWRSGMALVRHDVKTAYQARQWRRLCRGINEMGIFALRIVLGALQQQWIVQPQNRISSI